MSHHPRARALTAALLVSACAPEPPCGLRTCDIRDSECQRVAGEAAACLRGVSPVSVPVAVVSRAEHMAAAAATTVSPAEKESFHRWNAGLAALGLAPVDNSPGTGSAASAAQVDGSYSPANKQITVIDDGRPLDDWSFVALLVHEYAHALQDARFDLVHLDATRNTDLDRGLALGAVLEGEATYVADLAAFGFYGLRANDIPWQTVFENWQAKALDNARRSPLPVSLAWVHFRYPFGTGFVKGALDAGGWDRVDGLLAAPPSGTREVVAGFGAQEPAQGAWAEDLGADAMPILDARFEYVGADRMGAWLLEVFLNRFPKRIYGADDLPRLLRGDALSIFHDQVTGGAIAFWRLRLAPNGGSFDVAAAVGMLPAARREYAGNNDLVIVAASDQATLAGVPLGTLYQPMPMPAPTAAPLAGRGGIACFRGAQR